MLLTDKESCTHNEFINSVCLLGGIRGQRIYLTLTHWEPFEKFASRRVSAFDAMKFNAVKLPYSTDASSEPTVFEETEYRCESLMGIAR